MIPHSEGACDVHFSFVFEVTAKRCRIYQLKRLECHTIYGQENPCNTAIIGGLWALLNDYYEKYGNYGAVHVYTRTWPSGTRAHSKCHRLGWRFCSTIAGSILRTVCRCASLTRLPFVDLQNTSCFCRCCIRQTEETNNFKISEIRFETNMYFLTWQMKETKSSRS